MVFVSLVMEPPVVSTALIDVFIILGVFLDWIGLQLGMEGLWRII